MTRPDPAPGVAPVQATPIEGQQRPESTAAIPNRRTLVTATVAAGLAAALGIAYVLPPLAVVAVWPFLFLVPGWTLLTLARPRIDAAARLGLAVILSVAVSAHLVYWLSVAFGYRRETVYLAAAVMALPLPIAAWRGSPGSGSSLSAGRLARSIGRAIFRNRGVLAVALVSAGFVGVVLVSGLWHVTASGVDSGGSNWSDLGVHLSIAQSLNAGNFPPQVPYFAGVPLIYHWFADFHAAIAASAAGLFAIPVFIVSSAICSGALALIVGGLARNLLGGSRAKRVAILAAAFVVFAGGFGWIRFIGDVVSGYGNVAGGPIGLITHNSYDNAWYDAIGNPVAWPYFRIPSVMGTGLLVHRATAAGLPMLIGVVLLLSAGLPTAAQRAAGRSDRPALIGLAGLLGALLAPFHFFFFPVGLLLGLLWALGGGRLADRSALRNAAFFLAPYLFSLPFALPPLLQASASGALKLVPGWESAPFGDGALGVLFFYVTNLGVPLLLAAVALFSPRLPARWFLASWALALFVIPNVVQVSVIGFDMNKYFQAMAVALAILAAWLVRRWPASALAVVFALAIPSPLLVSTWTALNREQVLSADELAASGWIAANTPQDAVFATDGWLNSPTDPAGRLRLTTFTPYIANLGYDPGLRTGQVNQIYCSGSATRSAEVLGQLHASYVMAEGLPSPCDAPVDFSSSHVFDRVYANRSLVIYRLAGAGFVVTPFVSSAP